MAKFKGYVEDPEPPDDNDPEFQAEMFAIFRRRGYMPEDLYDPEYAAKHAEWLKTAPLEDE
jgi:hypothetical protein